MSAQRWASFCIASILMLAFSGSAEAGLRRAGSIEDLEYAKVGDLSLRLDAYLPSSSQPSPAVIIVHGGGWVGGDRRRDVQPLFEPLAQAGIAWFSISYRLATDVTQFGIAIEDVRSAIRFVKSKAAEFNIDAGRIALIGESAGGQLASMAVLRGGADVAVRAVVALYTPTDLVSLLNNSTYIPTRIRDSVRGTPWESLILAGISQLSPIDNVRPSMPPFLFIHGTADPLVPFAQSRDMCDRMQKAGASCELYAVGGAGHGIRWWESSPRIASGYKQKMVSWLESQFKTTAGASARNAARS